MQFASISLLSLRHFRPTKKWIVPGLMYGIINYLNNAVWGYGISVPMHTIIRSSGVAFTMVVGVFMGKTYSKRQVASVLVVGLGIALSLPKSSSESSSSLLAILILGTATILASIQGWLSVGITNNWQESLCMTHITSLPLFLYVAKDIFEQAKTLNAQSWRWLALNCLSQYACAMGVNKLATSRGPEALQITLTVRKFVSLAISAFYFGHVETNVLLGGVIVGSGALMYTLA